jgi:muramoyltetrapeptide carboxypeptidase LdcA involved in peptidoglycan recycling
MGYSDTTINHFMMYKAGLISFYGPSIMCEFGEYGKMFDYTKCAIQNILFQDTTNYTILSSQVWSNDFVSWEEKNINTSKRLQLDKHGYELLQGTGNVNGHLLGGCIDIFMMALCTEIWPSIEDWTGAIMFIEMSEDKPSPDLIKWTFRNFAAQGILKVINGIIVGKPQGEAFYEEYKLAITQVVTIEEHLNHLPIFYNVNFGHAMPIGIIPYGVNTELNCENRTITLLESATIE